MESRYIGRLGKYIAEKASRAFAGRRNRPDIFISATSADLMTVRTVVRDALLDSDCFPVEQSHFSPDYRKVEEMLRAKIRNCQAMIHIVGKRYGFEPNPQNLPPNTPRRSYTQMEYHIAKELGLRCYTFVCPEDFPYDEAGQPESPDKQTLQQKHRQQFFKSDDVFTEFNNRGQLKEEVLKLQNQLSELRDRIDKNSLKMWFAVLGNWLMLIMVVGVGCMWVNILGTSADAVVNEIRNGNASENLHTQAAADSIIQELRKDMAPDRLHAQAVALYDGKDYAGAFHKYVQLSDADPGNLDLHRRIEECARRGNLHKPFLDRYLSLAQQHPTNAVFYNYLGNAYLMIDPSDADDQALVYYENALRMDTNLAVPLANLGILAFRAGQTNEAEALFRRYVEAFPNDSQGWVNLSLPYIAEVRAVTNDIHSATEAESALRTALRLEPASAPAYKALGRLLAATGRKNEALNAFQRSLALNYEQADVRQQVELLSWESAGTRYPGVEMDDFTTRTLTSEGTETTNAPAAVVVMRLLDELRTEKALAICEAWTKQEPENPLAQHLLGRAFRGQGLQSESQKAFAEAERLAQLVHH